jgi:alkanesulfonate monooxygenase SsuD/methylene tetrahydromethanopterin reductase-like flavin-dependent oxidoreductase (luciferase family)
MLTLGTALIGGQEQLTFGLYLSTQFQARDQVTVRLAECLRQATAARDAAFGSIWAGSHYLTYPMISIQPIPLLARLIPDIGNMILGTNVLVLPLLSPVAVAEESATLNLLSEGRYVLGVGLGYRDAEFEAFGVSKNLRVRRFEEALQVIRLLSAGERVSYRGSSYCLADVGLGGWSDELEPVPIYIGGTAAPSIARAGRLADGLLMDIYLTLDELEQQAAIFRSAARDANRRPGELVVLRECFIGETNQAARSECRQALQAKYATYAAWGQDSFLKASDKFAQPLESFIEDRLLIGDATYVRKQIARYRDRLGAGHFVFRVHWPGLPIEAALNTIGGLGEILTDQRQANSQ